MQQLIWGSGEGLSLGLMGLGLKALHSVMMGKCRNLISESIFTNK
jgi:hypothetical protein